jgi:hypothetical protein
MFNDKLRAVLPIVQSAFPADRNCLSLFPYTTTPVYSRPEIEAQDGLCFHLCMEHSFLTLPLENLYI